jgi:hypothetical protein
MSVTTGPIIDMQVIRPPRRPASTSASVNSGPLSCCGNGRSRYLPRVVFDASDAWAMRNDHPNAAIGALGFAALALTAMALDPRHGGPPEGGPHTGRADTCGGRLLTSAPAPTMASGGPLSTTLIWRVMSPWRTICSSRASSLPKARRANSSFTRAGGWPAAVTIRRAAAPEYVHPVGRVASPQSRISIAGVSRPHDTDGGGSRATDAQLHPDGQRRGFWM